MTTVINLDAVCREQAAMVLPEAEAWGILDALLTKVSPADWHVGGTAEDGFIARHRDGRTVIVSVARQRDGRRWLHASVSRRGKLPSYDDLVDLHRTFIGADRRALQVFVPTAEHVNIHPTCLHLWACLDGDGLPDFTAGTGSV